MRRIDDEADHFRDRLQSAEAKAALEAFFRQEEVIVHRLQPGLDLLALAFQERRQRKLLAELVHRLVGGEARAVGRDLEQDAIRLAEIERAEIEAVDLARYWACRHPSADAPRRRNRASGMRKAT